MFCVEGIWRLGVLGSLLRGEGLGFLVEEVEGVGFGVQGGRWLV